MRGLLLVALAAGCLSACGQANSAGSVDGTTTVVGGSSSDSPTVQPEAEWSQLELLVSNALPRDGRSKSVRYDADKGRIVVTLYTKHKTISAAELAEVQRLAEEASDGVEVEIVTTDEDAPTLE